MESDAGDVATAGRVRHEVIGAYERVGPRARRLAMWIVHDEQAAADIVFEAFSLARPAPPSATLDDGNLLIDVRRRAITAAQTRGSWPAGSRDAAPGAPRRRVDTDAATVRDTVGALSEPQRGVIELALFGGLSVTAIAAATGAPRQEVLRLMVDALRALRIALALRGSAAP